MSTKGNEGTKEEVKDLAIQSTSKNFDILNLQSQQAVRELCKYVQNSNIVPDHFQGNPGNIWVATCYARALGEDPIIFMQDTYVVGGKLSFGAQKLIAKLNLSSLTKGRVKWKFNDTDNVEDLECTCYVTEEETGEVLESTFAWAEAKAEGTTNRKGNKYHSTPKLMLRYRSATRLVNLYFPEIKRGLPVAEEMEAAEPEAPGETSFVEECVEADPIKETAPEQEPEPDPEPAPDEKDAPPEPEQEPEPGQEPGEEHVDPDFDLKELELSEFIEEREPGKFFYISSGREVGGTLKGKKRRNSDEKNADDIVQPRILEEWTPPSGADEEESSQSTTDTDATEPETKSPTESEQEDEQEDDPEKERKAALTDLYYKLKKENVTTVQLGEYLKSRKWLFEGETIKDLKKKQIDKLVETADGVIHSRYTEWKGDA